MSSIVRAVSPQVTEPQPGTWSNCLVVDGIAYVATGTGLESYDLLTGEQLQSLPLSGGAVSLAVEGSFIYTMDSSSRLSAIDIRSPAMVAGASLLIPDGGVKIFVGNGIAYVAAASNTHGGFDTVDVNNPDALVLLRARTSPPMPAHRPPLSPPTARDWRSKSGKSILPSAAQPSSMSSPPPTTPIPAAC